MELMLITKSEYLKYIAEKKGSDEPTITCRKKIEKTKREKTHVAYLKGK